MSTGSNKSLSPSSPRPSEKSEIEKLLQSGLGDFSVRELLGALLSCLVHAERGAYLQDAPEDKANGYYPRSLLVGSVPLELDVPRTRSGQFRPPSLPARYQRGYREETQSLLLGLLSSSRSVSAARDALRKMGLSNSEQELEKVAAGFMEELGLRNTRPLDPDLLALFCDGKYVEVRDGDRLKPACIYLVIGLGRDGKKRVLTCLCKSGRENLEDWKFVLRSLLERGLRRVLIIVHDDFSGLLPLSKSLFPGADVQLCVVHMQRNARNHLSKTDNAEFQQRWRALRSSWDEQVGMTQFEDLCQRFQPGYPHFMAELRKKREHYLAFLKYPDVLRRCLSTTNVVEAVNGQLEILRRNSGGYFQSQDTLQLKLGITITSLENQRWRSVTGRVEVCLHQLNAQFQTRFEAES
ncbi:MAG: IS256 family transposase [Acidobacteria bacterium]|nr:IS256 family transposase [Acidobacteriota bacterium]